MTHPGLKPQCHLGLLTQILQHPLLSLDMATPLVQTLITSCLDCGRQSAGVGCNLPASSVSPLQPLLHSVAWVTQNSSGALSPLGSDRNASIGHSLPDPFLPLQSPTPHIDPVPASPDTGQSCSESSASSPQPPGFPQDSAQILPCVEVAFPL